VLFLLRYPVFYLVLTIPDFIYLLFRVKQAGRSTGVEPLNWRPGVSVIIPERGKPELLKKCLLCLQQALARIDEPWEVIVVVNGSPLSLYRQHGAVIKDARWLHDDRQLGFTTAIHKGIRGTGLACL